MDDKNDNILEMEKTQDIFFHFTSSGLVNNVAPTEAVPANKKFEYCRSAAGAISHRVTTLSIS